MVEKIPVRPESVRGLGNIISPAKTVEDFSVYNSSLSYVDGFYTMEYSTTSVRVELTASASSIRVGESLTLTATVTDGGTVVEGASVSFTSGNLAIGTAVTGSDGVATLTVSPLEAGSYSITATYDEVVSSAVSVTVNTAFTSVTVSSDKSILSYADSESATLTAQLMNGASTASVSGETVQFYRWVDGYADQSIGEWVVNNDVLIDTQDTNSSGVATGTYTSAGIGDIQVYAKVRSLVSEIFSIEDCTYYNSGTITSSQTLPISNMPTNFYASFTLRKTSNTNAVAWLNVGTDTDNCLFFGQAGANALGMYKRQNGSNTVIQYNNSLTSLNTDYLIEFSYVDGALTLKGANTTLTGNWSYTTRSHISTNIQSNNNMTGLKIKPL